MRPRKRILLVDSNEVARNVLACVLATRPYDVFEADSCQGALDSIRTVRFDAVLAALDMVPPDGGELARAIGGRCDLPVLVYSQRSSNFERASGAARFLPKGHTMADLLSAVRVCAARKRGPRRLSASVAVTAAAASA